MAWRGEFDAKVTIVDIGGIPPRDVAVTMPDLSGDTIISRTPREPLLDLVRALARLKPAAIGIDIDFSPEENGLFFLPSAGEKSEEAWLTEFLDIHEGRDPRLDSVSTPVYLGSHRAAFHGPGRHLGSASFEPMAASVAGLALEPDGDADARYMLNALVRERDSLPSLAARLAGHLDATPKRRDTTRTPGDTLQASRDTLSTSRSKLAQFFLAPTSRVYVELPFASRAALDRIHVDLSVAHRLDSTAIRVPNTDAETLNGLAGREDRVSGHVLVLGDAAQGRNGAEGEDRFGSRRDSVSGVSAHGAAVVALTTDPVLAPTRRGRSLLNALLIVLAYLVFPVVGLMVYVRWGRVTETDEWGFRLQLGYALFWFLAAVVFSRLTGILWSDAVILLLLVLLPELLGPVVRNLSSRARTVPRRFADAP